MNRYIVLQKIVELGSFTKAAETLGYTQSAVSQMVASLENEFSIKLLCRSRSGVKLTAEGETLFPYIEKTVYQYRAMLEKTKEIKGLDSGIIRIGTVSSISCHWLPQLIKEFESLHPNVRFVLHQGDYSSIEEWIRIGAVDFGFLTPAAVTDIQTLTVKEGRMMAVLPEEHPLAAEETVRLDALCKEPFILLEEGHYSEPLECFRMCGLKPEIKYIIHDDYAIMTMVEAELGVSILAELVLKRTGYHIAIRPTEPEIRRVMAIGYKDKKSLPIASRFFIDYLMQNRDRLL